MSTNLQNRNILVFGVSADDVATQKAFARSENVNFGLLADDKKALAKAYGVLGGDGLPRRVTFIIGPDGRIRGIDGNVDGQFTQEKGQLVSQHGANLRLLLSDWKGNLGCDTPNFFLADPEGGTVESRPGGKRATVLAFVDGRSPRHSTALKALEQLAASPAYASIAFRAIDVAPPVGKGGAQYPTPTAHVPLCRDAFGEVAPRFLIATAPTFIVLDGSGKVVYRGAWDNQREGRERIQYVREAVDAVLTRRPVPLPETPPVGKPL